MNEGVAISFAVIFVIVSLIGLVLFKEMRTHIFWRALVDSGDLEAIRGILDVEIEHWRTQRPPKGVSAAVWAGVQGMELVDANGRYVHLSTTVAAEFRAVDGKQAQVATALDTAMSASVKLIEMIFYDLPEYRPDVTRVDVFTTFRSESGSAEPRPILSVTAQRAEAIGIDWDDPSARAITLNFSTVFELSASGEPLPIELPATDESLSAPIEDAAGSDAAGDEEAGEATATDAEDRSSGVR